MGGYRPTLGKRHGTGEKTEDVDWTDGQRRGNKQTVGSATSVDGQGRADRPQPSRRCSYPPAKSRVGGHGVGIDHDLQGTNTSLEP